MVLLISRDQGIPNVFACWRSGAPGGKILAKFQYTSTDSRERERVSFGNSCCRLFTFCRCTYRSFLIPEFAKVYPKNLLFNSTNLRIKMLRTLSLLLVNLYFPHSLQLFSFLYNTPAYHTASVYIFANKFSKQTLFTFNTSGCGANWKRRTCLRYIFPPSKRTYNLSYGTHTRRS